MKKILSGFVIVLSVLLAIGCAQQPIQEELTSEQKQKRAQQSAKLHTDLAAEYYNRRQLKIAIEEASIALQADSKYAPAFNMLGLIHMTLHENKLAQKNFEHALKLSPEDSEIHNNYGWFLCQRELERMDQAIEHFMKALSDPLYSTSEKPYTNAGICELKRNNYEIAVEFFKQALVMQPVYSPALVGLIEVGFKKGNIVEAKAKLSHHMRHSTPTPGSLWLAIQIERKLGDRHAEDSYAFQLQKRFPNSKQALVLRKGRFE